MNKGEFIKTTGRHGPVAQTDSLLFRRLVVGERASLKQLSRKTTIQESREGSLNRIQLNPRETTRSGAVAASKAQGETSRIQLNPTESR